MIVKVFMFSLYAIIYYDISSTIWFTQLPQRQYMKYSISPVTGSFQLPQQWQASTCSTSIYRRQKDAYGNLEIWLDCEWWRWYVTVFSSIGFVKSRHHVSTCSEKYCLELYCFRQIFLRLVISSHITWPILTEKIDFLYRHTKISGNFFMSWTNVSSFPVKKVNLSWIFIKKTSGDEVPTSCKPTA